MQRNFLKYKFIFLLLIINFTSFGNNRKLSKDAVFSILTCDEGNEIYSLFGHIALRVKDKSTDEIYNWGMFEFSENQTEFGYNFAKGRLRYYMAIQKFDYFIYEYDYLNRGVREQILNINTSQKQELYNELQVNYLPENRVYKYDFFYDNCSSKIRDILYKILENKIIIHKHKDADRFTFRQIIHSRLKVVPWLNLGIDLVLGKKIDVLASNKDLMFLPSYFEQILDSSFMNINGELKPLVISKKTLIPTANIDKNERNNINKYFWILLGVTLLLYIIRIKFITALYFNTILFFTGILGVLLLFMWIYTDHNATKMNYNIIWANPLHLITFISIFSKNLRTKLKLYYLSMTIIMLVIVLFWIILTQELPSAIRPLILALTIIYYYLYSHSKKNY